VRGIAARRRRAVQLEVLQYGVTRQLLQQTMTRGGGPDILHLSGHGATGTLLLEHSDGSADPVPAAELISLLRPGRGRVKLAVLSACQSAAATAAETLRWLGLDQAAEQAEAQADIGPDNRPPSPSPPAHDPTAATTAALAAGSAMAGIASTVARQLDCPVVAMRYPVTDEFAITLADQLYQGLFDLDLTVDAAVAHAVAAAAGAQPSPDRPAISIATPTQLGGVAAAGLTLIPPEGLLHELHHGRSVVGRCRSHAVIHDWQRFQRSTIHRFEHALN